MMTTMKEPSIDEISRVFSSDAEDTEDTAGYLSESDLSVEPKDAIIEKLNDQITRLRAEFVNYRRRKAREWEKLKDRASIETFTIILPTLDNLEQAVSHPDMMNSGRDNYEAYRQGIELIYTDLRSTLEYEGFEPIDPEGQEFDPNLAEAVGLEYSAHREGNVIRTVQKGWKLKDTLIRPAKVIVSRGPEQRVDSPENMRDEQVYREKADPDWGL